MSQRSQVMDEELVQKIVVDEELVQNVVMDGKLVKTFVMDAKIDPKVVMDLSIFKIGEWNILQPNNRKLLEEGIEENDSQLLSIKIPSGDLFLTIQYLERQLMCDDPNVKGSKPLREGLHEMMQMLRTTALCSQ